MPVNLDQVRKGGVYKYQETFCAKTSEAIVKIISAKHTEDEYVFVVRVLETKCAQFPKAVFRIVISRNKSLARQAFQEL